MEDEGDSKIRLIKDLRIYAVGMLIYLNWLTIVSSEL